MVSVDIAGTRFQLRAAAVILHQRSVLLHRLDGDAFWALPGGRVEPGEDARTTLVREMQEELDERVVVDGLTFLVENFFTHANQPHHEVGMYFQAGLQAHSPLLDLSRTHWGVESGRRLEFRWFLCDQLADVDLCPHFLRQALAKPLLQFEHVVHREKLSSVANTSTTIDHPSNNHETKGAQGAK